MDPSEVPPVGPHRRDTVRFTPVVDLHHEGVLAGLEPTGHLHGERPETADMGGELVTVEEDPAGVVRTLEVKERSTCFSGIGLVVGIDREERSIPDGALVVEERRILGVPVAGDVEHHRSTEVVFDPIARRARFEVPEVSLPVSFAEDVDVAGVVWVDDGPPTAVESTPGSTQHVGEQRRASRRKGRQQIVVHPVGRLVTHLVTPRCFSASSHAHEM